MAKKSRKHLYEVTALFTPEISEEEADREIHLIRESIEKGGGTVLSQSRWRKRKLAYPIKKFSEGFYLVLDFTASVDLLPDLSYELKYNEKCLRFLIIQVEKHKGMLGKATRGALKTEEKRVMEEVAS